MSAGSVTPARVPPATGTRCCRGRGAGAGSRDRTGLFWSVKDHRHPPHGRSDHWERWTDGAAGGATAEQTGRPRSRRFARGADGGRILPGGTYPLVDPTGGVAWSPRGIHGANRRDRRGGDERRGRSTCSAVPYAAYLDTTRSQQWPLIYSEKVYKRSLFIPGFLRFQTSLGGGVTLPSGTFRGRLD